MRRFGAILTVCLLLANIVFLCEVSAQEEVAAQMIDSEALLASLWEADITSIKQAYEARIITCTELTQYYLERIETYNDTYNCFITLCDDALEQASLRDEQIKAGEEGALLGIPVVIKDNMDYAGYHTTNGYAKSSSQIADSNAQVVEYLLEAGAVIIGKTNMSTEAQDARASYSIAVGETKNAYNDLLAAGGSSGGSAVATSLNFAVAGLGTDTNSSLRLPAVLNGCISLRSTWNTLSTDGIVKLNGTRDVPGVITRTVTDQAIMLDVISGGTTNYAENLDGEALSGLRIGVLMELTNRDIKNTDSEVAAAFNNAIKELEACGAVVVEVSIPNILSLASITYNSGSAAKERMYNKIQTTMEENNVAALIFPTYLNTPLRSGTDDNGKTWYTSNQRFINNTSQFSSCAALPEIAVPIGYHSLGAGIGMEIAALKGQEQLLLDIAYSYTTNYDHRRAPENAPDLYEAYYSGDLYAQVNSYYELLDDILETVMSKSVLKIDSAESEITDESASIPTEGIVLSETDINSTWGNGVLDWVIAGVPILVVITFGCIRRKKKNC